MYTQNHELKLKVLTLIQSNFYFELEVLTLTKFKKVWSLNTKFCIKTSSSVILKIMSLSLGSLLQTQNYKFRVVVLSLNTKSWLERRIWCSEWEAPS